jgi:hypothetical protein
MNARNNTSAAALPHQLASTAQPAQIFARPVLWVGALLLFSTALLLGGLTAATIVLGAMIGALALVRPLTGLWMSVAFLVYATVFYIRWGLLASVEEMGYVGTAIGLAIIAVGLGLAWLRDAGRRLAIHKDAAVRRFDKAMYAMLGVSLIATVYGMARANAWSNVARQLFGCLLLTGYYLFGRAFFRSAKDIHQWLRWAGVAVTAGAAWFTVKLTLLSLSEGAYTREQSPLSFFAGAIGALLFVEFLWEEQRGKRIVMGVSLLFCVLANLLMGARMATASLAGTAIIVLILRRRKHRLLIGLATLALTALGAGLVLSYLPDLVGRGGLAGGIAARFSPLDPSQDSSYVGWRAEMDSILDIVRQHPVLGAGMGAEFTHYDPTIPDLYPTKTYVDNGWGYVLLKMGLTGLFVFVAMLWRFLRFAARDWPSDAPAHMQRVRACLLALLLFGLVSFIRGPTFFHFMTSGFMGTTLGALAALADLANRTPSLLTGDSAHHFL